MLHRSLESYTGHFWPIGVAMRQLILLLLVLPQFVVAADEPSESYLCIGDLATGFSYNNGSWQVTQFDASEMRFVVRERKESDSDLYPGYEWVVVEFGGEFRLHRKSGRFNIAVPNGYITGDVTPYMAIGECVSL